MKQTSKRASKTDGVTLIGQDLLTLRAQLSRAEKAARRVPTPPPSRVHKPAPIKPQREAELLGIATDEFSLHRAHAKLREAVYEGHYHLCPHAIGHARAEGFLEHDVMQVLLAGRVRAVYTEERRLLVCGYFESCSIALPLHVVVEYERDGFRNTSLGSRQGAAGHLGHLDIITAFVPKHPHHIISRARLAVMLRYDDQQIRTQGSAVGSKQGHYSKGHSKGNSKGKWKKSA